MLSQSSQRYRLLDNEGMRHCEAASIGEGVSEDSLMEAAGAAVAFETHNKCPHGRILILCGGGNNGGDGLVAARHLRHKQRNVDVVLLTEPRDGSAAARALKFYRQEGGTINKNENAPSLMASAAVIVDALWGTGLNRAVSGEGARWIDDVNKSRVPVVAVDMPSGINGDSGRIKGTHAIKATVTVTFAKRKLAHCLQPGRHHAGEVVVADIGIPQEAMAAVVSQFYDNDAALWRHHRRAFAWHDHKYTRGMALLKSGAPMAGAVNLAARGALASGAGMVAIEGDAHDGRNDEVVRLAANDSMAARSSAVLFGSGCLPSDDTRQRALDALTSPTPLVLDGGALTALTMDDVQKARHPHGVLTPHEGEFRSLFASIADAELSKAHGALLAAQETGMVVVRKGSDTVIASADGMCVINRHASPSLARAGSGDVLAGLITGLMAQGMMPFVAACYGVYWHGVAGRGCDFIGQLPNAIATRLACYHGTR